MNILRQSGLVSASHSCPPSHCFQHHQRRQGITSASGRKCGPSHKPKTFSRCSFAAKAAAPAVEAAPDLDLAKMEPLGDRVLVKPEEESSTTSSGLIVSSQSSGSSSGLQDAIVGEVIAVGKDVDIAVKAGDKVLFTKYSTSDISVPDGDVTFVAQKSILATLS